MLQPLQQTEWFGNARGYNITFREIALSPNVTRETFPKTITIEDPTSNSYILDNLEEYAQYEVIMIAFNDVGFSAPSPVALERTRESGENFSLIDYFIYLLFLKSLFLLTSFL